MWPRWPAPKGHHRLSFPRFFCGLASAHLQSVSEFGDGRDGNVELRPDRLNVTVATDQRVRRRRLALLPGAGHGDRRETGGEPRQRGSEVAIDHFMQSAKEIGGWYKIAGESPMFSYSEWTVVQDQGLSGLSMILLTGGAGLIPSNFVRGGPMKTRFTGKDGKIGLELPQAGLDHILR